MKELFLVLEKCIEEQQDCMLVTIVEGSGSIPRTAGAYMVVGEEGRVYGTIGGGNLEYQAILAAQKLVKEKRNHLQEYNLAAQGAASLGMVCGGHARVLFYYLGHADEACKTFVEKGVRAGREHKPYWVLLPLANGVAQIREQMETKRHQLLFCEEEQEYYAEQFTYDGKVYIFGGGHLAQETVPVLSHLGFRCIVADDREEFVQKELFSGAEEVKKVDFTKLSETFHVTEDDYIVVMTRGHLCDTDVERFALSTRASYIGIVGSRKKAAFVRDKLSKEGYTDEQLDRVITPIGLAIKAETPAEIAISIAGQLIQFRHEKCEDGGR